MNTLISVIIPSYNVEEWLPNCIQSILKQSYTNLEIILVNDGSTDNTLKICNSYAQQDSRIILIDKINGGISSARNKGIEYASGEYIVFIDPDDNIDNNYFDTLYNTAKLYACDAVVAGYKKVPINTDIKPGFKNGVVLEGREFVLSSLRVHSNNDLCFVWRYIYRAKLIKNNDLKFNENIFIGEDAIFNLNFLLLAQRVIAIPDIIYEYTVNNPQSLMRVSYKPKLEKSLILQHYHRKKISEEYNLFDKNWYKKDFANYYMKNIYPLMIGNLFNSPIKDKDAALARIAKLEMFKDSIKKIGFNYKCCNIREYLYFLALKFGVIKLIIKVHKKEILKVG